MVTDAQVRLLRQKRMEGKSQQSAAATASMSVRSARKWERGLLPSENKLQRHWRTRADPFEGVWAEQIEPLLRRDASGVLEATTILALLQERDPIRFGAAQLRTLQRRLRDWRALHGPEREVYFQQTHPPGREAQLDFTHGTALGITIQGEPFKHLLFELVLSYSGWRFVRIAYGETFEALVEGLQEALWTLGGAVAVVRMDNLSAATHDLRHGHGRVLTQRFAAVLEYYGLEATRITPRRAHENGVAEQAHRRLKRALAQALLIRGSGDFDRVQAYEAFVQTVVARLNRPTTARLEAERATLRPLPPTRLPVYSRYEVTVRKWSTIRVRSRTYSVPSRLIGHRVEVRQYADWVEVRYRGQLVERMPRLRGPREHRIDYRHVIWSLVRKPGAFARYRYREELFPTSAFRHTYDRLRRWRGDRADVEYVRILHLAASTMESGVEQALVALLESGQPFQYADVRARALPEKPAVPALASSTPDLGIYDGLLGVELR